MNKENLNKENLNEYKNEAAKTILFLFCLISFPSSSATWEEIRTYFCKNEQGAVYERTGIKRNGVWSFNSCGLMEEATLDEYCEDTIRYKYSYDKLCTNFKSNKENQK